MGEVMPPNLVHTEYPINLVLEVSAFCNFRCTVCPYPDMKRSKGFMDNALFFKIIKEITGGTKKGDVIIWLAFMGEPLILNHKLIDMVKTASSMGAEIYLNTNASMLSNGIAQLLSESGVKRIIVSLDAFKKETYEKIRRGGDFGRVKENVENMIYKNGPEVYVQFIVTEENKNEAEAFKEYWLVRGAAVKVRRKLGWGQAVDTYIGKSERTMPCPWLMRQMIVLWDGRVAQCDADYEGGHCVGNVNENTIREIWNGELYKKRERHIRGDYDFEPCRNCKDWEAGISDVYKP